MLSASDGEHALGKREELARRAKRWASASSPFYKPGPYDLEVTMLVRFGIKPHELYAMDAELVFELLAFASKDAV